MSYLTDQSSPCAGPPASLASDDPIRIAAVDRVLRERMKRFDGLRDIVDIYHAEVDLPLRVRLELRDVSLPERGFYGLYDAGARRIIFVAANVPSVLAAQRSLVDMLFRHEGRYAGLDFFLGGVELRKRCMVAVADAMPKHVARWLEDYSYEATWETRSEAAEEVLISWKKCGRLSRIFNSLLSCLAQRVRCFWPNFKLTRAEMRQLVSLADDFVDGKSVSLTGYLCGAFATTSEFM